MITNTGRTMITSQVASVSAQPAAVKWMAITTDATAAAATDTTLASEIATAGGGLIRAAIGSITYSGASGSNVVTMVQAFTVNASDTGLPVSIAKFGCFNAASAGTMAFEFKFAAVATVNAIGDAVTITEVVTFS